MSTPPGQDIEATIRAHHQAGDMQAAATAALEGYGPEILGMLHSLMADEDAAAEAFSTFTEDMWSGLSGFRWGSSFRTWAYRLAHNARHRYYRNPRQRMAARAVPLSDCPTVGQLAEQVRTATLMHLRTSVKDRMAALRGRLSPEEQTLLILRVDKRLDWGDVARIVLESEDPDEAELKRKSNALRQQFHKLKARLKELARREGLIP